MTEPEPDALERLAQRSAAVAAELAEVDRALEAEGLSDAELERLTDRQTCARLELADIADELRALEPPS
jgi:hypothetical protein